MSSGNLSTVFGPSIVGHSVPEPEPMQLINETKYQALVCLFPSALILSRTLLSLTPSGDFCHLLITFANSLDPDQA